MYAHPYVNDGNARVHLDMDLIANTKKASARLSFRSRVLLPTEGGLGLVGLGASNAHGHAAGSG